MGVAAPLGFAGCKKRGFNKAATKSLEDPGLDGSDPHWIYDGKLPHLSGVKITVSTKGHTARVQGFAPSGFDASKLPEYAHAENIGGKTRITVVYPIATVDESGVHEDGTPARNPDPGTYKSVSVFPYNPYGTGGAANKNTPWGGFPYIEYDHARNIAFHGPITRSSGLWQLMRGPVSHACNRMQGEHATELAWLLGTDMTVPHDVSDEDAVTMSVNVLNADKYDVIEDGDLAGKTVDVDYTPEPEVELPTSNVKKFATWDGMEHPEWVCMYRSSRDGMGMNQCADLKGASSGGGSGGSTGGTANAKICNLPTADANVRDSSLANVIGKTVAGEPVVRTRETKTDGSGQVFEKLQFFKSAAGAAGPGWVLQDFVCDK